jgi:hypothetical protein
MLSDLVSSMFSSATLYALFEYEIFFIFLYNSFLRQVFSVGVVEKENIIWLLSNLLYVSNSLQCYSKSIFWSLTLISFQFWFAFCFVLGKQLLSLRYIGEYEFEVVYDESSLVLLISLDYFNRNVLSKIHNYGWKQKDSLLLIIDWRRAIFPNCTNNFWLWKLEVISPICSKK